MTKLEKDLEQFMRTHRVKKIAGNKPKCPIGTKPVQIIVNGRKMWVCK
jgi:hypothetical protein